MPQCWSHKIIELRNWWISTKGRSQILTYVLLLRLWRCSGQSVTASDFRSNGPQFESGRGRCVGQGSLLPLSQGEAFTLASISCLAILVKYILAKKKKKKKKKIWKWRNFNTCLLKTEALAGCARNKKPISRNQSSFGHTLVQPSY